MSKQARREEDWRRVGLTKPGAGAKPRESQAVGIRLTAREVECLKNRVKTGPVLTKMRYVWRKAIGDNTGYSSRSVSQLFEKCEYSGINCREEACTRASLKVCYTMTLMLTIIMVKNDKGRKRRRLP